MEHDAVSVIEAVLFASGSVVSHEKLAFALGVSEQRLPGVMEMAMESYNASNRALKIVELQDGYQLCTREEYYDLIAETLREVKSTALSAAALEVLAVIAYNQPVTRAYIEQIRGVDSSGVLTKLLEKGLIEDAGKLDAPGRPRLFSVTQEFLRVFGLKNLTELPNAEVVADRGLEKAGESFEGQIPIPGV